MHSYELPVTLIFFRVIFSLMKIGKGIDMKNLRYTTALQSGRSMVEMLGTLAIIGVLSIGGIAGYSYGMDKYRANTIINDVNLRAIDLIAQANRGGDLSLSEWSAKTAGNYDIGLEMESGEATGGIFVKGVKQPVCEMLSEALIQTATVKIGTVEYTDATNIVCGEENDMVFYYDDILDTNEKTCQDMENGVCFDKTEPMTCSTDADCPNTACYNCFNKMCLIKGGAACPLEENGAWDGICYKGECRPKDKQKTCTAHSDCDPDEFCTLTLAGLAGIDATCQPLAFYKENIVLSDNTSKTLYVNSVSLSAEDMVDACDRIGKKLPRLSELEPSFSISDCVSGYLQGTPTDLYNKIREKSNGILVNRQDWYDGISSIVLWGERGCTFYAPGEIIGTGFVCY